MTVLHPARTGSLTRRRGAARASFVLVGLAVALAVLALVNLVQGTAHIGVGDVISALLGRADADRSRRVFGVLTGSRGPRLVTGVLVGALLGMAGVALQTLTGNPLASPTTLGISAGAQLAITIALVSGAGLGSPLTSGLLTFLGGMGAAAIVIAVGGRGSTARLVLVGAAVTMALGAVTGALKILFAEETLGLFSWGVGSLLVVNLDSVRTLLPVMVVVVAAMVLMAKKTDLLPLGDDAASLLGLQVSRTRLFLVVSATLLTGCAVVLAGPMGFVGLFAPAVVTMIGRYEPTLLHHRWRYPAAGMLGAVTVVGADVSLRLALGPTGGVRIPTGIFTTILGAVLLIVIARNSAAARATDRTASVAVVSRRRAAVIFVIAVVMVCLAALVGLMFSKNVVTPGTILSWIWGGADGVATRDLPFRLPRVLAALLAGAALGAAGTVTQTVARNPLAEPGLLGVTAGAGLASVIIITAAPHTGAAVLTVYASVGALLTFALVALLAYRGGLDSGRFVLIGIGVSAVLSAVTSALIVLTDPLNRAKALTWLGGSTYGRDLHQAIPVAVVLLVMMPPLMIQRRRLDILGLDDDTPRLLGISLASSRAIFLTVAAVLTASAVTAIGVISFVGLIAPHSARAMIGAAHARALPLSMLVGALLVSVGDTLGRTVILPNELPAGTVAVLVGAPYFIYLLWRAHA